MSLYQHDVSVKSSPIEYQDSVKIDGYCDYEDKVISNVPLILFGDHTKNEKMITTPFVIGADGTKLHKIIMADVKFVYY